MAENKIAKPFLKWAGGKTQLIPEIEKALPINILKAEFTYIEPFIGSGAVLFWMLNKFPNIKKAIINDINEDLIYTYKTIASRPQELISFLEIFQNEFHALDSNNEVKKLYYYQKRDLYNSRECPQSEQAALFIFLNRTCFNGLYRVNRKNEYNVPMGSYIKPTISDKENILAVSEALQKVEILSGDFEQTLDYADNNSLFYFDPPYKPLSETSSFNSYAKYEFNDNEQIRLRDFCKKLDDLDHNWILSNSDVRGKDKNDNFFDDLYSDFKIKRIEAKRNINANPDKRGKLTELLIVNKKKYLKALDFNKYDLFVKNYDKPYWTLIEKVPINNIKIDKRLLSYANELSTNKVDEIIKNFDLLYWIPITVNKDFYLLDGQHRLSAARRMDLKFIDVIVQDTELLQK
ncbi:MAG: Dam family site-specific DNA-(adenine-N6)-methyltransferase [Bacteroidales bacterium]